MGFLNNSGFARLWSHIMLRLGDKVDKVDGKGLSTEDFTTEEKEKLAGLSTEGLASEVYVEEYVDNAVSVGVANLVNSAPETLDTLGEIATALEENADVVEVLEKAVGDKVDKVDGMGLMPEVDEADGTWKYLVTDGEGNTKWDERLAWKEGEKIEITWDGNTEGLTAVNSGTGTFLYKVSDLVFTNDAIKSGRATAAGQTIEIASLWETCISDGLVTDEAVSIVGSIVFARTDGAEVSGIVFPEKGVYFMRMDMDSNMFVSSFTSGIGAVKLIDPDLINLILPETTLTATSNGGSGSGQQFFAYFDPNIELKPSDYVRVVADGINYDAQVVAETDRPDYLYFIDVYTNDMLWLTFADGRQATIVKQGAEEDWKVFNVGNNWNSCAIAMYRMTPADLPVNGTPVVPITDESEGKLLGVQNGVWAAVANNSVLYTEQELTEEQQMQARKNLGLYYSDSEETAIMSEQTINFTSDGSVENVLSTMLVEGSTYTVIWDGVTYECLARNVGDGAIYIGNQQFGIDAGVEFSESYSSNEPFFILTYAGDNYSWIVTSKIEAQHAVSIICDKETVHSVPVKYLPDGIGYTTFGDKTTIVDNVSITIEEGNPSTDPFVIEIVEGEVYTVTWDGTEYECTAYIAEGPNTPSIGNGEVANANGGNGEPFFITVFQGQVMVFASETGTHSITVKNSGKTIHRIPEEYLPAPNVVIGIAKSSYYNFIKLDEINGASAKELYEAADAGKQIFIRSVNNQFTYACVGYVQGEDVVSTGYLMAGLHASQSNIYTPVICYCMIFKDNGEYGVIGIGEWEPMEKIYTGGCDNGSIFSVLNGEINITMPDESLSDTSVNPVQNKAIHKAIYSPKDSIALTDNTNGYTYVVYMENGNLVSRCGVKNIDVTIIPTKVEYMVGEYFDPTGMVVTATAYDGSVYEITDYSYSSDYLTEGTISVQISYMEAGLKFTTDVLVSVSAFDAAAVLVDFEYTDNGNDTYTITGWKGTYNGEPGTEMIVPNYGCIKI